MKMISCEGKDGEKDISTPPMKKLKQARLSFQKLSPGVEKVSPQNSKKRKIDEDSGDDIKVIKVVKTNSTPECLKDDSVSDHSANINDVDKVNIAEKANGDIKEVNIGESKSEDGNNSLLPSEENVTNTSDALISEVKVSENESESNDSASDELVGEVKNKDITLSDTDEVKKDDTTLNDTVDEEIDDNSSSDESDDGSDNDTTLNDTVDGFNSSSSAIIDGTPHQESASSSFIETPEKGSNKIGSITPSRDIIRKKKLTPKQILRRQEIAKKREEREMRKKEKEVMKAKEKEVKEKNKLERQEKRRKEKEEREEQKKKEREEKEKKKQAELELKSEEKRLKEEERRLKEEEKRKKEEQKKKKDEKKIAEEEANKKVAAAFVNFFVTSKLESKTTDDQKCNTDEHFMPFQVKADMRLAPSLRTNFDNCRAENFDKIIKEQTQSELYLSQLRSKAFVPGSCKRTWPLQEFRESSSQDDEDVIFVNEESKVEELLPTSNQPKAKLFLFCENRRPPFWGTWRKKSKLIKPTQPFAKDTNYFDYEVDSDDEWEEEEPGESLHGSDDEKESEDEYEVDNEFFVPHGYLSEEENDGEEDDSMSPETMKAKLKLLEMEFEEEMKHKTERVKPRLFGCFWINENSNVDSRILGVLNSYRAVYQENPITICEPLTPETNSPESENVNVNSVSSSKRKKFLESFVPDLLRLVHGNINGRGFLVKEFLAFLKNNSQNSKGDMNVSENNESTPSRIASKLSIGNKIKQMASWIACPEEGPFLNRKCWYVPKEIRSAYGLEELVIPNNTWNYILSPKRELELSNTIPSPCVPLDTRQKSLPLITKFTKKMTQEELQKQLALTSPGCDSDIEIVDEIKSGTPSLVSLSTSQDVCVGSSNGCVPKQKNKPEGEPADAKKGTGKFNEIRQTLLPFKAKSSCETPVTHRKRVPILMSVPLGQKISSPSLKSGSVDFEEGNGKKKVAEKEANTVCS